MHQPRSRRSTRPRVRRAVAVMAVGAVVLAVSVSIGGCGTAQPSGSLESTSLQAAMGPDGITPAEIQAEIMSFADGHAVRLIETLNRALLTVESDAHRAEVQGYKVAAVYGSYILASGPNPVAGMIDLAVVVTLGRQALEDHWKPLVLGDAADPMIEQQRMSEEEIWKLCERALYPDEIDELRDLIDEYRESHGDMWHASFARVSDISAFRRQMHTSPSGEDRGLLRLLNIDPLANLDPATRELERSRLLAERAFYFLKRAPLLLELQVESIQYTAAVTPVALELREGLRSALDTSDEMVDIVAEYPDQIGSILEREREALLVGLTEAVRAERDATLQALDEPRTELKGLLDELHDTLDAGTTLSDSLRGTVDALNAAGVMHPSGDVAPGTQSPGVQLDEVRHVLEATTEAAIRLDQLVRSIDETAARDGGTLDALQTTVADMEAASVRLMNRAFLLAALVAGGSILLAGGMLVVVRKRA